MGLTVAGVAVAMVLAVVSFFFLIGEANRLEFVRTFKKDPASPEAAAAVTKWLQDTLKLIEEDQKAGRAEAEAQMKGCLETGIRLATKFGFGRLVVVKL